MFATLVKGQDYRLGTHVFIKDQKTAVDEETFNYLQGNEQFKLEDGQEEPVELTDLKVADLLKIAENLNIEGAKNMKKAELIEAITAVEK